MAMAVDAKARRVSVGFPGGAISGTRGLLEAAFGAGLVAAEQSGSQTVAVKGHLRTRVIGQLPKVIAPNAYTLKKFPSGRSNGGAGGEAIQLLVDGDWWTARLTGSHQDFNDWLSGATWSSGKTIMWRSEKGTTYGPFKATTTPILP